MISMRRGSPPRNMPRATDCATFTRRTSRFWSQELARPHSNCSRTAPDLDVIFVPVGGGSGVLGAGTVARAVNPAIQVIGVQAEGAPAVYRSWREGRQVVTESVNTFAEGLATREPFAMPLAFSPAWSMKSCWSVTTRSPRRSACSSRRPARSSKGLAQRALAAAMKRRDHLAGKNVGLILSGGNITIEQLKQIISGERP